MVNCVGFECSCIFREVAFMLRANEMKDLPDGFQEVSVDATEHPFELLADAVRVARLLGAPTVEIEETQGDYRRRFVVPVLESEESA